MGKLIIDNSNYLLYNELKQNIDSIKPLSDHLKWIATNTILNNTSLTINVDKNGLYLLCLYQGGSWDYYGLILINITMYEQYNGYDIIVGREYIESVGIVVNTNKTIDIKNNQIANVQYSLYRIHYDLNNS